MIKKVIFKLSIFQPRFAALEKPAARTAVIGRPPSPPTAPVMGLTPIDEGGTTFPLPPKPLCEVAILAAVGGGLLP